MSNHFQRERSASSICNEHKDGAASAAQMTLLNEVNTRGHLAIHPSSGTLDNLIAYVLRTGCLPKAVIAEEGKEFCSRF